MTETKKVFLIGKKGSGKSTLFDILTLNENEFEEKSNKDAIGGGTIKRKEKAFSVSGEKYSIIAVPSFDRDNKEKIVEEIERECGEGGLIKIFFVMDCPEPGKVERDMYKKLSEIFGDEEIYGSHVVIIRTKFPSSGEGIREDKETLKYEFKEEGLRLPSRVIHFDYEVLEERQKVKTSVGFYLTGSYFYKLGDSVTTNKELQSSSEIQQDKKTSTNAKNDDIQTKKQELIGQIKSIIDDLEGYSDLFKSLEGKNENWKEEIKNIKNANQFQEKSDKVLKDMYNCFFNILNEYQQSIRPTVNSGDLEYKGES
jgi:energy-coupling factor transporter ATP-binding protein EcfA2